MIKIFDYEKHVFLESMYLEDLYCILSVLRFMVSLYLKICKVVICLTIDDLSHFNGKLLSFFLKDT